MTIQIQPRLLATWIACLAASLAGTAQAGPLSIGMSNQVQVGWMRTSQSATWVTRLLEQGTAGENIRPDGSTSFSVVGTPFVPANPGASFEYRSSLRDTTTVTDRQSESLTIYGTQSNTYNTTNTAALGYFQQGNSAF